MVRDYFTQGHFQKYEPTNAFDLYVSVPTDIFGLSIVV